MRHDNDGEEVRFWGAWCVVFCTLPEERLDRLVCCATGGVGVVYVLPSRMHARTPLRYEGLGEGDERRMGGVGASVLGFVACLESG